MVDFGMSIVESGLENSFTTKDTKEILQVREASSLAAVV
jgi:hypothetical protein